MTRAGVAALRRLGRTARGHDGCGLCGAAIAAAHDHLIEPRARRIECACRACALLFDGGADTRWRRLGRSITQVEGPALEAAWEALGLPIALAFVARWAQDDGPPLPVATSPSPLGLIDHPMRDDRFAALAAAHPAIAAMAPDVEALLVARPPLRAFVVSIDRCFALAGRIRAAGATFGRGPGLDAEVARYFTELESARA